MLPRIFAWRQVYFQLSTYLHVCSYFTSIDTQLVVIFLCGQMQTSTSNQTSKCMTDNILGERAQLLKPLEIIDTIGVGFVIGQSELTHKIILIILQMNYGLV